VCPVWSVVTADVRTVAVRDARTSRGFTALVQGGSAPYACAGILVTAVQIGVLAADIGLSQDVWKE
jgi:hypothetical protein